MVRRWLGELDELEAAVVALDVLAQAPMAPAAELVGHLGIPVLSSPKPGLEKAMAMYQTLDA